MNPHGPTCVSLQGAIFLFFAGRIEAIKGNVDAVSSRVRAGPLGVAQASRKSATEGHTQGQSQLRGGPQGRTHRRAGAGEVLPTKAIWEDKGETAVWGRILTGR